MDRHIIIIAILAAIILPGCSASKVSQPEPAARTEILKAPMQISPVQESWEQSWEKLVSAAKKEGRLSVYTSAGSIPQRELSRAFKEKYGIVAEIISMRGSESISKILTERRAGLYLVDVYVGSATETLGRLKPASAIEPVKPVLILPDLVEPAIIQKMWRDGKLLWMDREYFSLAVLMGVSPTMAINSNLVKAGKISYMDLLDPMWTERILLNNPIVAGTGNKWANMVGWKIMNWDYLRELAKQKPMIITDQRLQGDWLAQGKYPITIAPQSTVILELQQSGAPVSMVTPTEGAYVSVASGSVSLMNKAPHPNAAILFINWLLSREGGEVFSQAYAKPSVRTDVSTEGIPSYAIPDPNGKYYIGEGEEYILLQDELTIKTKEIFGPLLK